MGEASLRCVGILKRHLDPSLEMLAGVIANCPEDLWLRTEGGAPFWQQVYHTAYFIDFWLRESYDGAEFRSVILAGDVSFELDKASATHLTREELGGYLAKVREKLTRFFASLTDARLLEPIVSWSSVTYSDAIVSQIRHVQYHVGHCNGILGDNGVKAVEWLGYGEG